MKNGQPGMSKHENGLEGCDEDRCKECHELWPCSWFVEGCLVAKIDDQTAQLSERDATIARLTTQIDTEKEQAVEMRDGWDYARVAAEQWQARFRELEDRIASAVDYIENVGIGGVTWTVEDSERDLLAILVPEEDA